MAAEHGFPPDDNDRDAGLRATIATGQAVAPDPMTTTSASDPNSLHLPFRGIFRLESAGT